MDTLLSMQVFCRVVEAGSFIAAANQLRLSPAMTSRHVSNIESHLSARLLNRNTRNLSLTEAGSIYYQQCREVLDQLNDVEEQISQSVTAPKGRLKISALVSFGIRHLLEPVQEYMKQYPEVTLDLDVSDREVNLADEAFDIALRVDQTLSPGLIARRLCPVRITLVCSPEYAQKYGVPKTPEELKQHRTIGYNYSKTGDAWNFLGTDGKLISVPLNPVMRVNHGEMGRRVALSGLGISCEPTFIVADDIRNGDLIPLLPDYPQPELSLYAVYLSRRFLSAKVRTFIDYMVDCFQGEPEWDKNLNLRGDAQDDFEQETLKLPANF